MESFHSVDAFQFILWTWRLFGLISNPKYKTLNTVYKIFICIWMFFPAFQEIAQAFLVPTYAELVNNLTYSLEWTCNTLKFFSFIPWFKRVLSAHRFLEHLDVRVQRFDEELKLMHRVVKNCRRLFVVSGIVFTASFLCFAVNGAVEKKLMFEAYMPWDWKSSTKNYMMAFGYQGITATCLLLTTLAIDNLAISYVYITWGHMKSLAMRISRIGYDNTMSQEDNYIELIKCIHDHGNINEFFELVRPAVSGTILIQFMVSAFALCLAIFDYFFFGSSMAKLLTTLIYVLVIFVEVIPCCYFVNDLMVSSDNLTTALYSSNWMEQTPKFRKTIIIFMQRTQKRTVVRAANLVPVTLQTCFGIIRFSFSMFTFLRHLK